VIYGRCVPLYLDSALFHASVNRLIAYRDYLGEGNTRVILAAAQRPVCISHWIIVGGERRYKTRRKVEQCRFPSLPREIGAPCVHRTRALLAPYNFITRLVRALHLRPRRNARTTRVILRRPISIPLEKRRIYRLAIHLGTRGTRLIGESLDSI